MLQHIGRVQFEWVRMRMHQVKKDGYDDANCKLQHGMLVHEDWHRRQQQFS